MGEIKTIKKRNEISDEYKWKVDLIYSSVELWEKDFEALKNIAPSLKNYVGKLHSGKTLYEFVVEKEKIDRAAEKLFMYAHLKSDEDTINPEFQGLKNKVDAYLSELRSYSAFMVPEMLSEKDGYVERVIEEEPRLAQYRYTLEDIFKMKPHTLSKEGEEILASVSNCLSGAGNIYSMLTNADMTFPVIEDENGGKVELTEVNYGGFIRSKNRRVREDAFKALFETYKKFSNTFATSLTSNIKNMIFEANLRHYNSCLEMSLKPNNIPLEVYRNAVDAINEGLPALHRYVSIKKKLLGLNEMHMYDLYVSVIDIEKEHIEYENAVEIVKEGLKPLGQEYLSIFSEGINNGWVDVYENKGKRGGAYSWGSFDTMPYVLLNYNYDLNDVSTLAHEMGHSIHSYYSRKTQPYVYAGYSLFCAEVASTTNEALLINHLINKETDKNRKLYLINQELEQIRTTVFRQLMFAEFELVTHENMEKGNPLSAEHLNKIWHDLNVKYFGPDMVVDDEVDIEWARIPHFYSDFYVYQYATGYAAASAFAKAILKDGDKAVEMYKGFLKAGSSDYPINVLRNAGVDMTTPGPIKATIDRFNELLDMLEEK